MIATPQEAKNKQCAKEPSKWCKGAECMAWVWVKVPDPRFNGKESRLPIPFVDGTSGRCGWIE